MQTDLIVGYSLAGYIEAKVIDFVYEKRFAMTTNLLYHFALPIVSAYTL